MFTRRQRFSGVSVREQLRYALEAIPGGLNAVLTDVPFIRPDNGRVSIQIA